MIVRSINAYSEIEILAITALMIVVLVGLNSYGSGSFYNKHLLILFARISRIFAVLNVPCYLHRMIHMRIRIFHTQHPVLVIKYRLDMDTLIFRAVDGTTHQL